jgi:exodeoxyribonuclease-5
MTELKWSPQQSAALHLVDKWLNDPSAEQVLMLFGYAGTGKTTLAKFLAEGVKGPVLFGAYTGKAASVLRKMGCPGATTIHSMLYSVSDADRTRLHELQAEYAAMMESETVDPIERRDLELTIEDLEEKLRQPIFTKQEDSIIRDAKVVVIDECSMVNKEIGTDLESFGTKILVMGDPAQLPPVQGGGYYTRRSPDVMLTEIHRQARDNPIIRWATKVRNGEELDFGAEGTCKKIRKQLVRQSELVDGSQLLVGKNVTRRKLNVMARRKLGFQDDSALSVFPQKGDKLVVLRNDKDWGVMNGVVCESLSDAVPGPDDDECIVLDVKYEDRDLFAMPVDRAHFDVYAGGEEAKDNWGRRWMVPMDYGYALTVHKAQGSQWERVTLCDDGFGSWERNLRQQWLYTAITRASHELTIIA